MQYTSQSYLGQCLRDVFILKPFNNVSLISHFPIQKRSQLLDDASNCTVGIIPLAESLRRTLLNVAEKIKNFDSRVKNMDCILVLSVDPTCCTNLDYSGKLKQTI